MSLTKIPVACVQLLAHDREDFAQAWPRIAARIDEAGRLGARLIVLPEGTVPGYVLGREAVRPEELERAAAHVAELARRYGATIVYGGAVLEGGRTFNAAIAVGPSGRIGHASKQFLWHFDRRWYAPGETLEPIETPFGKLGLLVCADGRIPTIAATLVERGAQLLVMPTAWVTSGRNPQTLENLQADLMASVRARENGVPFAIANKCGVERRSVAYCGKSALIDARGGFVARGSERNEEIVLAELALGAPAHAPLGPRTDASATRATPHPAKPRESPSPQRIAFTTARGVELARFAALAADADADLLLARGSDRAERALAVPVLDIASPGAVLETHGVEAAVMTSQTFRAPRGLVERRLAGCDLFVWHADGDPGWDASTARTRAAELRAFVVVFAGERRAYAVDPDGVVVAGTFGDYEMATFVYDRARAAATQVAPSTDILAGLRSAERIRSLLLAEPIDA